MPRVAARAALRTVHRLFFSDLPLMSAGMALYALLAVVPIMTAIVSIYGLIADPRQIHRHLASLTIVFPPAVVRFVIDELEREASRSSNALGFALAGSIFLALLSARSVAGACVTTLQYAYRVPDRREFAHRQAFNLTVSLIAIVGMVVTAALVVGLPALVALFRLGASVRAMAEQLRWPLLLVAYTAAVLGMYRMAPSHAPPGGRRLWPGAIVATVVWMATSFGLSVYVDRVTNYETVYGAFGGVMIVILWFYLTAISVVVGALLNAELERAAEPAG
jgi:membrane protein